MIHLGFAARDRLSLGLGFRVIGFRALWGQGLGFRVLMIHVALAEKGKVFLISCNQMLGMQLASPDKQVNNQVNLQRSAVKKTNTGRQTTKKQLMNT